MPSNDVDLIGAIEAEFGYNAGYVIALLDKFQKDPAEVDPEWRSYFQRLTGDGNGSVSPTTTKTEQPALTEPQPAAIEPRQPERAAVAKPEAATQGEAVPLRGGGSLTPARRALDKPMAIACLVERAPCFPSRM